MGRQYKLVVCDQLEVTISQRKKKKIPFLTLKSRRRVRNLTCWKRSEMQVKPELILEIELQTCNKNLFITLHLMDQTENGKQNKPDCNLFIVFDTFCRLHGSTLPQVVRGYHRNYPFSPTISTHNLTSRGYLLISS